MLKKIGYGLILWVIPYVTAIPLMGLMQTDLIFFKTIMIVGGGNRRRRSLRTVSR